MPYLYASYKKKSNMAEYIGKKETLHFRGFKLKQIQQKKRKLTKYSQTVG